MRILLTLTALLWTLPVLAQNLIPNGGFEDLRQCPRTLGELDKAKGWTSPNGGTPDLFNECYQKDAGTCGVPTNFFSTQTPFEGRGYAGIYLGEEETEYVQVGLAAPLEEGKRYVLRFRAALANPEKDAISFLKAGWGSKAAVQKSWDALPDTTLLDFVQGTGDWRFMSAVFVARGDEQYLRLGYFGRPGFKSYTYLDAFELYACPVASVCTAEDFDGYTDPDTLNLVVNGGFEAHRGCPEGRDEGENFRYWRTFLTADCYHACGTEGGGIPTNEMGYQPAHGGEGYAGFFGFSGANGSNSECLTIRLRRPLAPRQSYRLRFWLSLADRSEAFLHKIGARLDQDYYPDDPRHPLLPGSSLYLIPAPRNQVDSDAWVEYDTTIVAQGGEAYLTLGNFTFCRDTCFQKVLQPETDPKSVNFLCYYYLDDVSLLPVPARTSARLEGKD